MTDGKRVFISGGWPKNHTMAVEADGSGEVAAKYARVYVPSMLVKGDQLYATMDAGFAVCWDSATGKERWKERLGGAFSPPLFSPATAFTPPISRAKATCSARTRKSSSCWPPINLARKCTPPGYQRQPPLPPSHRQARRPTEWLYCIGKN